MPEINYYLCNLIKEERETVEDTKTSKVILERAMHYFLHPPVDCDVSTIAMRTIDSTLDKKVRLRMGFKLGRKFYIWGRELNIPFLSRPFSSDIL